MISGIPLQSFISILNLLKGDGTCHMVLRYVNHISMLTGRQRSRHRTREFSILVNVSNVVDPYQSKAILF